MKRNTVVALFLSLVLIISLGTGIFSYGIEQKSDLKQNLNNTTYLHIGSPIMLDKGKIKFLDEKNPDVTATIIEGRTLLPIRAVGEMFGADVSYDDKNKLVSIIYEKEKYNFPLGKNYFNKESLLGNKNIKMDSKAIIIEGRAMVPARAICENIIGKKVSYYQNLIAVSNMELDLKNQKETTDFVKDKIGYAVKASNMSALKKALKVGSEYGYTYMDVAKSADGNVTNEGETANPSDASQNENTSSNNHSETNTQVEGIAEADVVKTDGKYIYIAALNGIRIINANNGQMEEAGVIRISTDQNIEEMYIGDGKLTVLGTRYELNNNGYYKYENDIYLEKAIGIMPPYFRTKSYAFMDVYDITNPSKPTFVKSHETEGTYQTSRKNGNLVYMVANDYVQGEIYLPMVKDSAKSDKYYEMDINDITIIPKQPSTGYVIVSAVNLDNTDKGEVFAITGYGSTIYMNKNALYMSTDDYSGKTSVIKLKIEGNKIGYAGTCKVDGFILNQFSMDEHEGYFRVATTTWENENALYIVDSNLDIVGQVLDIAKNERIYSVRFMGDKGYIVTFRNMDPLFVFDLSDPQNPKITGELKIPGFSNYLHPVGEDLLLGIGQDTYEIYKKDENGKDVVIGSRQGGIKISLFDVSDMGKPKEISKKIIGDEGSSAEVMYNHKALMSDLDNSIVAFDATVYEGINQNKYKQEAIILSYKSNQIDLKGVIEAKESELYGNYIPSARRVIYVGNELYYINQSIINSYNYQTLNHIDQLILQ